MIDRLLTWCDNHPPSMRTVAGILLIVDLLGALLAEQMPAMVRPVMGAVLAFTTTTVLVVGTWLTRTQRG